jgi:glycosyltransferase involved in cell wall biosynthesis
MNDRNPLVSIICTTYNHEKYIAQALEGFLMQKTNFSFEIIVHDDASTDNTANILREYEARFPELIFPIYQIENQYSKQDINIWADITFPKARGEYIAICEGDDYWIDPLKLQKQLDFLEKNQEYGMCYTKCKNFFQESGEIQKKSWGGNGVSFNELMNSNCIPTLTTVIRVKLLEEYFLDINPKLNQWMMGDYPIWIWFTKNSKIKFIDEVTGIYRVRRTSLSHSSEVEDKIIFAKSYLSIQRFYAKKYKLEISDIEFGKIELSIELKIYAIYGDLFSFLKTWYFGIYKNILNVFVFRNYRYIIFFIIPSLREKRL